MNKIEVEKILNPHQTIEHIKELKKLDLISERQQNMLEKRLKNTSTIIKKTSHQKQEIEEIKLLYPYGTVIGIKINIESEKIRDDYYQELANLQGENILIKKTTKDLLKVMEKISTHKAFEIKNDFIHVRAGDKKCRIAINPFSKEEGYYTISIIAGYNYTEEEKEKIKEKIKEII